MAQLVRASDRNSEDPGSNPSWISMPFIAIIQLLQIKYIFQRTDFCLVFMHSCCALVLLSGTPRSTRKEPESKKVGINVTHFNYIPSLVPRPLPPKAPPSLFHRPSHHPVFGDSQFYWYTRIMLSILPRQTEGRGIQTIFRPFLSKES